MEWIFYYTPRGQPSWVVIGDDGSGGGVGSAPAWPRPTAYSQLVGDMPMRVPPAGVTVERAGFRPARRGYRSDHLGYGSSKGFKLVYDTAAARADAGRSHDLALPSGYSGEVGYSGIGDFFKTVGKAIGTGFKWAGQQAWKRRDTISDWIVNAGGPASFSDACLFDASCQKYYVLEVASGAVTGVREARSGECIGKRLVDAGQVPGWVSSCGITWPWEGTVSPTGTPGEPSGPGAEYYVSKYAWIPIAGIALLVVLSLVKRGGGGYYTRRLPEKRGARA